MDGGAWWAAVHGAAKSRTRLSDFTFTSPGRNIGGVCVGQGGIIPPIDFPLWSIRENTAFIWRFLPKANHINGT